MRKGAIKRTSKSTSITKESKSETYILRRREKTNSRSADHARLNGSSTYPELRHTHNHNGHKFCKSILNTT